MLFTASAAFTRWISISPLLPRIERRWWITKALRDVIDKWKGENGVTGILCVCRKGVVSPVLVHARSCLVMRLKKEPKRKPVFFTLAQFPIFDGF